MVVVWYSISKGWRFFFSTYGSCSRRRYSCSFWHDRWSEDTPLKILYPDLFERSSANDACISNVLGHQGDGNDRVWNLRLYGDFHDWELEAVFSFLDLI